MNFKENDEKSIEDVSAGYGLRRRPWRRVFPSDTVRRIIRLYYAPKTRRKQC